MSDTPEAQLDEDLQARLSGPMLGESLRPTTGDVTMAYPSAKDGHATTALPTPGPDDEDAHATMAMPTSDTDDGNATMALPRPGDAPGRGTEEPGLTSFMGAWQELVLLPLPDAPRGVIGVGGEGVVYSYVQRELGREVAVKAIRPDRVSYAAIENLVREGCVTARLEHPNIVPVHYLHLPEFDGDTPYWVMKRIRGNTLTSYLPEGEEPWPFEKLLEVFRRMLDALAFAHSRGIVHRDLKPDNVLVGEFGEVQVSDWGLAVAVSEDGARGATPVLENEALSKAIAQQKDSTRPASAALTGDQLSTNLSQLAEEVRAGRVGALLNTDAGGRAGTPVYMAPEQLDVSAEHISERTDVFLLGGILYAMLTGKPPHRLELGDEDCTVRDRMDRIRSCGSIAAVSEVRAKSARNLAASTAAEGAVDRPMYDALDELPPEAFEELSEITMKALAAAPEERYQSVAELRDALDDWESRSTSQTLCAQASERLEEVAENPRAAARAYAEVIALADASLEQWADNEDAQHIREQASAGLAAIQRKSTRRLWIAVAASVLVVVAGAVGWFQYLDAKVQRAKAVTEEKKAKQAAKEEAEQRLVAEAAEKTAVDALGKEKEARNAEAEARKRAEAAEKTAVDALDKEKEARNAEAQARKEAEKQRERAQAEERKAKKAARLLAKQLDKAYSEAYQKFVDRGDSVGRLLVAVAAQDHARKSNIADTSRRWQEEIWSSSDLCPQLVSTAPHRLPWSSVTFSPDGKLFAAASEQGTIKIWDTSTGTEKAQMAGRSSPVYSLRFDPTGRVLAAGGLNVIRLWDVANRRETASLRLKRDTRKLGPNDKVSSARATSLSFTPDGRVLAAGVCYSGGKSEAVLWDVQAHREMSPLERESGGRRSAETASVPLTDQHDRDGIKTHAVSFSPNGLMLASVSSLSSEDHTVKLWSVGGDASKGTLRFWKSQEQSTLQLWRNPPEKPRQQDHAYRVNCLAFSPNSMVLAFGGVDGTVRLWDLTSQDSPRTLKGHGAGIASLAFGPDSRRLAAATQDGAVKLWDTGTERQQATLRAHGAAIRSIEFSPDGAVLASAGRDKAIRIWQLREGLAAGILEGEDFTSSVLGVSFASDGVTLASTGGKAESVCLWDTAAGRLLYRLGGGRGAINCLSYGFRRRTLATGAQNGAVVLWNPATRRQAAELKGHRGGVSCFSFSTDGRSLASTGYSDSAIRLWDTLSGRQKATLGERLGRVWSLSFGTDGTTLASGYDNGIIRLWNVAARTSSATIEGHTGKKVTGVAFSPDGRLLASSGSDHQVKIWDVASRAEKCVLKGHEGDVNSVAFSRDGRWVASASSDHTVKLWDPKTGLLRADLKGHSARVACLDFSPNGKLLASGSADRTVRLWRVPVAKTLTLRHVSRLTASRLDGFGVEHAADVATVPSVASRLRFSASQ